MLSISTVVTRVFLPLWLLAGLMGAADARLAFAVAGGLGAPASACVTAPAAGTGSADGVPTIDIAPPTEIGELARGVALLADPTRRLTAEDVLRVPAERWRSNHGGQLELAAGVVDWWVHLRLKNSAGVMRDVVLEVDAPRLDRIEFHLVDDGRPVESFMTGDQRPFSTRPMAAVDFALPLQLAPGAVRDILLRVESRNGSAAVLPMRLTDARHLAVAQKRALLGWGAYYGAVLALLLYNLLLYASTRDHLFLLYVAYLTAFAVWTLGPLTGIGFWWLWPEHPEWNNYFDLMVPGLMLIPATVFVTHYLGTRQLTPVLHRAIIGLTVLTQVWWILGETLPAIPAGLAAWPGIVLGFIATTSVLPLTYLLAGVVAYRRGYAPARFFLLAWSFLIVGVLVHQLTRVSGIWLTSALAQHSVLLGSTLEFVLLALALGDRFNGIRDQQLAAERKARELEVANAAVLEEKVRERTRDLDQAMRQVRHSLELERRARDEQREFLATVSHELRAPLTLIHTVAQNLLLDDAAAEATRVRYTKVMGAAERMSTLLHSYLDEQRFELLRDGPKAVPTDMRRLLDDVAAAARVLADGQSVQVDCSDLPTAFACDPDLIGLALRSLADNAIKHTPPGTTVTLRGRLAGMRGSDGVRFEVIDDGPGLSVDEVARVFEPGFRGKGAIGKPGKGMGLALARHNIELQGGTLSVTSAPGKGSCFGIWLPGQSGAKSDA